MTHRTTTTPQLRTLDDLLQRLGSVPPNRVRLTPMPGLATEKDVLTVDDREGRLCELVDGVLVEKTVGYRESLLACALIAALEDFVTKRSLGLVSGEAGFLRLFPGLVRIPDVAFVSWNRLPGQEVPTEPIPDLAPDLVVEILSRGNTAQEMARKREEYFRAGVPLLWIVDPETRTVSVYTSPSESTVLDETQALDGGQALPGFTLPLKKLFAKLDAGPGR